METEFTAKDKMSRHVSRMTGRLARFKRIAARVGRVLKRAGRAAIMMGRVMATAGKAGFVAIAGAATGAFLAITKITGRMDKLAKTARSINFPIEEFQEWRFVAEQSGVETNVFDKSIQKFTRSMGELKGGYGSLFTALKKSDKQLLKQLKNTDDVSDALQIYLKAIGDAEGATNKAALSAAGFGRAGIDMINIANTSAEGIAKLRSEMRENGVVTAEQAAKAEEFNDMMNRVKVTVASVATDALSPLIPMLTLGADKLRKLILANREMIQQRVEEAFHAIVRAAKQAYEWWLKNQDEVKAFAADLFDLGKMLLKIVGFLIRNKEAIIALGVAIAGLKFASAISGLQGIAGAAGAASGSLQTMLGFMGKAGMVGAAGAAGFGIGTLFQKGVIEPGAQKQVAAEQDLQKFITEQSRRVLRGQVSQQEMAATAQFLRKEISRREGFTAKAGAFFTGEGDTNVSAIKESRVLLEQIAEASKNMRMAPQGLDYMTETVPTTATVNNNTTKKEQVTLTIKDESGKAEVTSDTGATGLDLVMTGAAG